MADILPLRDAQDDDWHDDWPDSAYDAWADVLLDLIGWNPEAVLADGQGDAPEGGAE